MAELIEGNIIEGGMSREQARATRWERFLAAGPIDGEDIEIRYSRFLKMCEPVIEGVDPRPLNAMRTAAAIMGQLTMLTGPCTVVLDMLLAHRQGEEPPEATLERIFQQLEKAKEDNRKLMEELARHQGSITVSAGQAQT